MKHHWLESKAGGWGIFWVPGELGWMDWWYLAVELVMLPSSPWSPQGLNCGAWECQVESRRSPCQCSCLVSSCGFPCAHIKGPLVAVWSLHSPLSKLLRSMFYPSSDSNCWYLKSELISFFSPSAHLGYLTGREFFSWMRGRKGNVCVCGRGEIRCERENISCTGNLPVSKSQYLFSSWNSEMCGPANI